MPGASRSRSAPKPAAEPKAVTAALEDTAAASETPLTRTETVQGRRDTVASPTLAAGMQLGHFRVEKQLGVGGMGEVYLATDLALDRRVALKVLPESVAKDSVRRDRLIKEARAQARVSHPNVAHIYFIGEQQDRLYFAMEYITGQTLADKLVAGPLPVHDALALIRSAALGLREAQRSGFTHRDVKPSNLMVDAHGILKVVDFGLASGGGEHADHEGPVEQTSIAGTPLYMAPEQARGEAVDFRSDIYSLGATLFQLVSGAPPFVAETPGALMSLHATAARPTLRRRSGQARTEITVIDALCARMMAPTPAERFATYDDLIREIELASESHTRPAGAVVRVLAGVTDVILTAIACALLMFVASRLGVISKEADIEPPIITLLVAYRGIAMARWGRSLGQALFELEVVDISTATRPGFGRAMLRSAIPLSIALITIWADFFAGLADIEPVIAFELAIGVAFVLMTPLGMMWASLRVPGKRTLWDRWTRTMVRYRTRRSNVL